MSFNPYIKNPPTDGTEIINPPVVVDNIPVFNDTEGNALKDSGIAITDISGSVSTPVTPVVVDNIVSYSNTLGTEIKDSGISIADINSVPKSFVSNGGDIDVFTGSIGNSSFKLRFITTSSDNQFRLDSTIATTTYDFASFSPSAQIQAAIVAEYPTIDSASIVATSNRYFSGDGLIDADKALNTTGDIQQVFFVLTNNATYFCIDAWVQRLGTRFMGKYSIGEGTV